MTTIPVEVGQVRLDPDPRNEGKRTVTVERVNGRIARAVGNTGRHTTIALYRLERWTLVTPTPTEPTP